MHARILLIAFTLFLMSCSDNKNKNFQGYVEGEFVYVASSVSGRLDRLNVQRGQTIPVNTLLYALEATDEQATHHQALEQWQASIAQYKDLETGKRPIELDVIRAQVQEAIANEKRSATQLKRDLEQYAAGGIAKGQLDDSRYQHDSDLAKVQEMRKQLASAKLPARSDQILAQAAQVKAAQAALALAKWRLDQKTIYSTRQGLVFDTLYREGEWVNAGYPVIQMLPPQNIKVRFFVSEKILGTLKLNQSVTIKFEGNKSGVEGKITYISSQSEYTPPVIYSNETRSKLTFMIEAHPSIENAPLLHPGQPVEVLLS